MSFDGNMDTLIAESIQRAQGIAPTQAATVPRETVESAGLTEATPQAEAAQPKSETIKPEPQENKAAAKEEQPLANEYGDEPSEPEKVTDDYGHEVEAPRTYSKAEMDEYANRLIRERLARLERNHPPPTQQQQQQAQQSGFQYDENSNLDWQQQLEQFVFQAADKREQLRAQQYQQAQQAQRVAEFEAKFKSGMDKFKDFHQVVSGKNVTDEMLLAASDIADPAALFYAAAKRMPEELAKIAQIENPYAQAAAIGRLDMKLRVQPKKTSSAPKPVSQTKPDTTMPAYQPKQSTGNELDDLLIADNARRLQLINSRRR